MPPVLEKDASHPLREALDRFLEQIRKLRSSVPGTREFRDRYRCRIGQKLKEVYHGLRELQAVEGLQKARIAVPIKRCELRIAEADFWREVIADLLNALFLMVLLVGFNRGALYVARFISGVYPPWWLWMFPAQAQAISWLSPWALQPACQTRPAASAPMPP